MRRFGDHIILTIAAIVMVVPLAMVLAGAMTGGGLSGMWNRWPSWSGLHANIARLADMTGAAVTPSVTNMVWTSVALASGVAVLTTAIAFLAAYAMVFLDRRATRVWFWITLATLYFPIEARMLPTFDIAADLGLTNTMAGMVLPILPLALGTLVFRQHLMTFPTEIMEAARLDGAGPLKFLLEFVLPMSMVPIGAVMVITFMVGWNQYLWPLMISLDNGLFPLMRGLNLAQLGSGPSMVLAALSILPPLILVLAFLRLMSRVTAIRA